VHPQGYPPCVGYPCCIAPTEPRPTIIFLAGMHILILAPYPAGEAPSQRFRFEQYLSALRENGIRYDYVPFISLSTWQILHKPGKFWQKATGIVAAFFRRLKLMRKLNKYDFVFIHREASHIGPPLFEWCIARVFRKKIIYDFDDAIWLPNYSSHNAAFHKLKQYGKVRHIMRWSYKVSAGNQWLANFAKQQQPRVVVNPTTIDTEGYHNQMAQHDMGAVPIIGWTGTLTTAKYLKPLEAVLQQLEREHRFVFEVISNEPPPIQLKSLRFRKWQKATEIEDLLRFHVGVMPLVADAWSEGKCGFKALQYMALGVPALISPIGVNQQIVDHGVNGFWCEHEADWYRYLERLLQNPAERQQMGKAARQKIESHYSVAANTANFLGLFD